MRVGDLDEYGNEYRHGNMYAVEKCGDHDKGRLVGVGAIPPLSI